MLKRTCPAVSFSASHRALYLKSNRPLLGGNLVSTERYRIAWDEMPFTIFHWAQKDKSTWDWRCRYEFGLRDDYRLTKIRTFAMYCVPVWAAGNFYAFYYPFFYLIVTDKAPEYCSREGGPAHAWKYYGKKVWAADGKFLKPFYHINPPMMTITTEEVKELKESGNF